MEPNVMEERLHAHALLDILPADKVSAVRGLLEVMLPDVEPLSVSLARAEVTDEEVSAETAAAIDRARAAAERGETIPHDDILREFGLL